MTIVPCQNDKIYPEVMQQWLRKQTIFLVFVYLLKGNGGQ